MEEKLYKYAHLLLTKGVCINEYQPLVINAPIDAIKFVRILTKVACEMNIKDIYYDWTDEELKHTQLKYFNEEEIKESRFWNKSVHDEYAKKDAAFLHLTFAGSDLMGDIESKKLKIASSQSLLTRKLYREKQSNNEIDWCIAAVATKEWGDLLFGNIKDSEEKLWELIFDICLVNTDNPEEAWTKKMEENHSICEKLTNLNIKELHYESSNGTNLTVELPKNAIWCGGSSLIKGREPIVNMPTEEVFTTPNKYKTNGVVYTSLPLVHSGITIKDIMLEFKDGKIINFDASTGKEELKNIIDLDEESSMLGEVALVDKNSKIAKTNVLFYETLYDENASCHIAVGRGFKECIKDAHNMTEKELEEIGYNNSKNHVDMMVGTKDLNITAITYDNKEIQIFKDGSFNV
jgi:aminopeptidase